MTTYTKAMLDHEAKVNTKGYRNGRCGEATCGEKVKAIDWQISVGDHHYPWMTVITECKAGHMGSINVAI